MGGKVALLCASIVDSTHVKAVLALDPVDINPVEFTNENGNNLPLNDNDDSADMQSTNATTTASKHIPISVTCTDGGRGISKLHDGSAIHRLHPHTAYHRHEHSGHMAYCDHGGGWAGKLMPDIGTPEGNAAARKAAHELIRQMMLSE